MAAATPGSQAFPDGLTWEVITPQRARAALLRRSVPAVEQPITALPRRQPQLAKTPSSPTNRNTTAVGTEGPQHATIDALPNQALQGRVNQSALRNQQIDLCKRILRRATPSSLSSEPSVQPSTRQRNSSHPNRDETLPINFRTTS